MTSIFIDYFLLLSFVFALSSGLFLVLKAVRLV